MYLVSLESSFKMSENGVYFMLLSWILFELSKFQIEHGPWIWKWAHHFCSWWAHRPIIVSDDLKLWLDSRIKWIPTGCAGCWLHALLRSTSTMGYISTRLSGVSCATLVHNRVPIALVPAGSPVLFTSRWRCAPSSDRYSQHKSVQRIQTTHIWLCKPDWIELKLPLSKYCLDSRTLL